LLVDPQLAISTNPPAKLNFFLEVVRRRGDGFHDIDTVMSPIDWCDRLTLRRTLEPGIRLRCDWSPSKSAMAKQLGLNDSEAAILDIPSGPSNLVHQAIEKFAQAFSIPYGWECQLEKEIPAGAGMGGASSDAASALLCAAALCNVDASDDRIDQIAAEIGSDVPFFLGQKGSNTAGSSSENQSASVGGQSSVQYGDQASQNEYLSHRPQLDASMPVISTRIPYQAARATGRGTKLQPVSIGTSPSLVVAFPGVNLSTAKVYQHCQVPATPLSADGFLQAWKLGDHAAVDSLMTNRLAEPARKLSNQIDEMLESMWHYGARTCQLTGSGSACFAIVDSAEAAIRMAKQMRDAGSQLARPSTLTSVPAQLRFQRI
jgi:4-diphosphocytidyl-2-C-methyl-D-erythritol kinase